MKKRFRWLLPGSVLVALFGFLRCDQQTEQTEILLTVTSTVMVDQLPRALNGVF